MLSSPAPALPTHAGDNWPTFPSHSFLYHLVILGVVCCLPLCYFSTCPCPLPFLSLHTPSSKLSCLLPGLLRIFLTDL